MISDYDLPLRTVQLMNEVIYEIYGLRNRDLYLEKINADNFSLPQSIYDFCKHNSIMIDLVNSVENKVMHSCWTWRLTAPSYIYESERTDYWTHLYISKLCPVYYLHSRYRTTDRNPDGIVNGILDADGHLGGPITTLQERMYTLIERLLNNLGLFKISRMMAEFVVIGLENIAQKKRYISEKRLFVPSLFHADYFEVMFQYCYDDFDVMSYYYMKRKHDILEQDGVV